MEGQLRSLQLVLSEQGEALHKAREELAVQLRLGVGYLNRLGESANEIQRLTSDAEVARLHRIGLEGEIARLAAERLQDAARAQELLEATGALTQEDNTECIRSLQGEVETLKARVAELERELASLEHSSIDGGGDNDSELAGSPLDRGPSSPPADWNNSQFPGSPP
jgi:chaperonin cofactor prefoldin